jgi:hypothetical protein
MVRWIVEKYKDALADYISTLEKSMNETTRAEDRSQYQKHLATAALMYVAIAKERSIQRLRELESSERHSYGWHYLSGPAGEATEASFNTFAEKVEAD